MHRHFVRAALLLVALCASAGAQDSVHLTLGNPSKARKDTSDKDNYLIVKDQYALSYNNAKGTPNWVAWHLCKGDLGDAERKPFFPETLPQGFHRVKPADYKFTETGFDRGHLCPHADRDGTDENAKATFSMANMVPQSHELNGGAWSTLENYCREQAKKGKELYIVAGPAGKGGTTSKGTFETIADGKVTVPENCWKVILILDDEEGNDVKRVDKETRVIAVVMPNDTKVLKQKWSKYQVSVEEVEKLTGHTFFDALPKKVAKELRKKGADPVEK